ncbi:hypothetical protein C8A03DRAFT_38833 [Achaetomium macrosporum]|uniref:Uncharacterized protein n=1 Tax=Achaetomium macrosporum TaxID=79813 RepID=A0AAN7C1F6_9PEZI|nr:hypothetical protein C8A03DRAFT_38833 [Achaetomium macrosporum]
MAGSQKDNQSWRQPPAQQDVTQQMKGLSLGSAPAGKEYRYEELPSYQYASSADLGYGGTPAQSTRYQPPTYQPATYYSPAQPAAAAGPRTPSPQIGPTAAYLTAADKLLRALEKAGKLPPFKPTGFGKWTHDKLPQAPAASGPKQSSKQYSSGAIPQQYPPSATSGQKGAPARYRCDCGKSYGNDKQARAALDKHLDKHRSHRRAK